MVSECADLVDVVCMPSLCKTHRQGGVRVIMIVLGVVSKCADLVDVACMPSLCKTERSNIGPWIVPEARTVNLAWILVLVSRKPVECRKTKHTSFIDT